MKKSLIVLLVMVVLTSCFGCKSFRINVNLDNTTGKTVYLSRLEKGGMTTIDSVVAKDNKAVFKVKQSDNKDAFHIMIKGWRRPLTFFADNQNVTITGDFQKYNEIKVVASESQNKLNKFFEEMSQVDDEKEIYYKSAEFVKDNRESEISPYVLYRYKWAFPLDDLEDIYGVIPEDMQSGYMFEIVNYMEGLRKTSQGNPYIDFKQKDVNGEYFAMSEVIGKSKVIILDFWASWCPDCRKANPELVALYNDLKDKGLDIVSVSLDTDETAWKKAIVDDNLSWKHHVSDLKGWNNEVAQMYMIAFIPQNFVIDQNGTIIEKNLDGDKLRECVSSLLR